ncbi:MAG: TadE/TadG family type IV pilus assembly protein [Candidatus Limnocylindrales bacterium]
MPPRPSTPPRTPIRRSCRGARRADERGQSLVEFSLILVPLLLLILGVVQFGFIFNSMVTLSTAAREAARDGSIYQYDRTISKAANDTARNNRAKSTLIASMNGLSKTTPQFASSTSWTTTSSGTTTTYTNGDIVMIYELPSGVTDSDTRTGYRMTVRAAYHQDLLIPLIASLLPKDSNGRLGLTGEVTMVIN